MDGGGHDLFYGIISVPGAGNKENHEKRKPQDLFSGPTSKKRDFWNTKQTYPTAMSGEN
jgi:hypothetical protein